jgi:hypothetical protein
MPGQQKPSGSVDERADTHRTSASSDVGARSSTRANGRVADGSKVERNGTVRPRRRAVVAGINDYKKIANPLPSCINDVNAFVEVLEKDFAFDEIVRLVDDEATVVNVTAALQELFANASPDDRLVFFFSGHGTTALRSGVMEECIVLSDGFLFDDTISQMTQAIPPGILTLVIDSCFSGGLEKRLLAPVFKGFGVVERAQVKAYTRPSHQEFVEHAEAQDRATAVKRFGETVLVRNSPIIANSLDPVIGFQALMPAPASDESRQVQMKGVLLSACLETETAAASTALTEGKSAFTFALLHSLKKLGAGATLAALVGATRSTIKSIGLTQTPLLKEPQLPAGIRFRSFINFGAPKDGGEAAAATDVMSSLLGLFKRLSSGGLTMDASALIQLLLSAANKDYQSGQQKLFGIDDAILIPAIVSVVTSAIKGEQPSGTDKSLLGDAIRIAGGLIKSPQPAEQKLFGIDDAILIPAIVSVVTSAIKGEQPGGTDKSLLGDAIRIAGGLIKSPQPAEQKLFGIDDAILIPAIASVITQAIKGQQLADKSPLGDAIRIAGGLIKGQQHVEQKLFSMDDPIFASVAAAIRRQQLGGVNGRVLGAA